MVKITALSVLDDSLKFVSHKVAKKIFKVPHCVPYSKTPLTNEDI